MFQDYTYIVTGCTGYVGNVLTKKLLAEGCRVVGFARSFKKAAVVFKEKAPEIVYGDITDPNDIEKLFVGEGPFAVIHTAAKVSIGEDARSVTLFGQGSVALNYATSGSSATDSSNYADFKTVLESRGFRVNQTLWDRMKSNDFKSYIRNFNTVMATAAQTVIAEPEEICDEPLNPAEITVPGIFIDYLVK